MKKENNYQFHSIQNELICCHNVSSQSQKDELLPYHRHNACEIYLFIRGNTRLYIEQSCFQLCAGSLAVINLNELHRSICLDEQPYERYCINIKQELIEQLSSHHTNLFACFNHFPGKNNLIQLTNEQIAEFVALFNSLEAATSFHDYGFDLLLQAEAIKLLVFINRLYNQSECCTKDIMPPLVKETMLYVQEHLQEPISLESLANHFYRNGSYISQQFKKYTGLTMREYILDQRICLAKSYLLQGKTVSEACELSGFSDYSNFIRSFTKLTGISPGKFIKQMTKAVPMNGLVRRSLSIYGISLPWHMNIM